MQQNEGLLEEILRNSSDEAPRVSEETLSRMKSVGDHFRGQDVSFEHAVVELVRAVIEGEGVLAGGLSAEAREDMAARIARSLCDDPSARTRVESLWGRLCGTVPGWQ